MRLIRALLLTVLVIALLGCGLLRNTASPSARLVGHWFSDEAVDYYFGPVGTSGKGTLVIVDEQGERIDQYYRILSEDQEENLITLAFEGELEREITLLIPTDAIFMQERGPGVDPEDAMDYTFIDTRLEPLVVEGEE